MRYRAITTATCAALLAGACAPAEEAATSQGTPDESVAELSRDDAMILDWVGQKYAALIAKEDIPAASIGIIHDGRPIGFLNYGSLSRTDDTPVDDGSIYQIASLSKTLTGIITQSLVEDGTLVLHQPITTWLAALLTPAATQRLGAITLEQLLQHRSGIVDGDCSLYRMRVDGEPWLAGYTRDQLVADLDALDVSDAPDPGFQYSSCGYAVVGLIDELASGQSYEALLRDRVTSVYDMPSTVVERGAAERGRVVTPYRKTDRGVATQASIMGMGTPGSAVYSTTHDLLRVQEQQLRAYRAVMAGGEPGGALYLTAEKSPGMDGPGGVQMRFGSGLIEIPHPDGTFYLHDGDADGFASVYVFSPEHDVGLVLLTSSGGAWTTGPLIEAMFGIIGGAYKESGGLNHP